MRTPRIDLRDHCAQRRPTVVTAIAPLASDVPPGRLSQVSALRLVGRRRAQAIMSCRRRDWRICPRPAPAVQTAQTKTTSMSTDGPRSATPIVARVGSVSAGKLAFQASFISAFIDMSVM